MNEQEINATLSKLIVCMMEKGLILPDAQIWFKANAGVTVYLKWDSQEPEKASYDREDSLFISGADADDAVAKARLKIAAMPSPDKRKFKVFMQAVSRAVDLGRKNGIDVAFVNPLEKLMKDLSKNVLTFQGDKQAD